MVEYFQKGLVVCDYDRIIGFTDRGAGGIMEIGLVDALSAKQPEFQKMLRLWNLMISIK